MNPSLSYLTPEGQGKADRQAGRTADPMRHYLTPNKHAEYMAGYREDAKTPAAPPPLPVGMTRKEAIEGLRELRDLAVKGQRRTDRTFVRWPDMDALLDYIEEYGLPL
jgi:hypothetical protein